MVALLFQRKPLTRLSLVAGLIVALAAPPAPSAAQPGAAGFDAAIQLTGGPGGAAKWTIVPDGGTSTGQPDSNADCQTAVNTGIMLDDAALGTQQDAYDQAGLWINGRVFTATTVISDGQSLTAGPMPAGDLLVTLAYSALPSSPTLRTLLSAHNPTAAALPITATLAVNFGSDADTTLLATSDGNATADASDRWVISADDAASVTDVVNTTVWLGPGAVRTPPALVIDQVFACPGAGDIAGLLAEFQLTVPAGATRRLLFFQRIDATPGEAQAGAGGFNAAPAAGSDLAAGLSQDQLGEIVNWPYQPMVFLPYLGK